MPSRSYLLALLLALTIAGQGIALHAQNPSTFGRPSNLDPTQTTASIQAASRTLLLASPTSFFPTQGVLIAHAGQPCGVTRGTPCPTGPRPSLTSSQPGPAHTYRTACIDGLGGISPAGPPARSSGPATLTLPPLPGCIAVAIYRNESLIALQYASLTAPYTFADTGQPSVPHHRDLPLTPPRNPLADNLPAQLTTLTGTTAQLSTRALTSVVNAQVFHSDTPLVQAAIDASTGATIGDTPYRINYPLNATGRGGSLQLSLLCDTGDLCLDVTGQYNLTLSSLSLNTFGILTQPSTIGLFCARSRQHDHSQFLNTDHLFIDLKAALSPTAHGTVAYYNYACEIQNHLAPQFNADQLVVLTSNNLWNVHSPFDATQLEGSQSMSQISFEQAAGGTVGAFYTLENAYSIGIYGGYNLGASSGGYPWAFEVYGQVGDLHVIGYRTELRGGFAHLHPNARLVYSTIDYGLYRSAATTPVLQLDDNAIVSQLHLRADDYGGSPTPQPIYTCATARCSFANSQLDTGYWQTFDPTHATGTLVHATRDGSLRYLNGETNLNPAAIPPAFAPPPFTGIKTTGTCIFHITNGLITSVTGCKTPP